ncbi:Uncharacterised protein [Candidatus Tiddalikarchaeum anstoanum]|nr:Uncharacterised protein [Candidatus Tiddalikarchaeum anstoanum]
MKKTILILIAVLLIAGCTGGSQQTNTRTGPASGTLETSASLEDSSIPAGESTQMEVTLTNMFSQPLENIDIKVEPTITGLSYNVNGATSLDSNDTRKWDIEIITLPGMNKRVYNIYPVICFDYAEEYKGFFTISNGSAPTSELDTSLSENGPIDINVEGLSSFNARNTEKLDVKVLYAFNSNMVGGTGLYTDESELKFTSGYFKLDALNNKLKLTTLEGGSQNYFNKDSTNTCPVQAGGDDFGFGLCHFTSQPNYDASKQFDFDIIPSGTLSGESESSFVTGVTYRFCYKATDSTALTITEAS